MVLVALLSALFGFSMATEPTSPVSNEFDFFNYLVNSEWDVLQSSINQSTSSYQHSDILGHYSFLKDNSTSSLALIGRYYENDTSAVIETIDNVSSVHVMFDTPSSGSWLISNENEAPMKVFDFSFIHATNSQPNAVGSWLADDVKSFYLMQIAQPTRFTIVVTPTTFDEKHAVTMYSLKKKVDASAKSFFQKYGTWLMLGVFFIVQMYMKTKGKMGDAAAAAAPRPTAAAQAVKKTK